MNHLDHYVWENIPGQSQVSEFKEMLQMTFNSGRYI